MPLANANFLRNSDYIVLADQPNLYDEGEEPNKTIVVKNIMGDTVLMFPKSAVSQKLQHEDDPNKIHLFINSNTRLQVPYTFGFSTLSQASYFIEYFD